MLIFNTRVGGRKGGWVLGVGEWPPLRGGVL